MSHPTPILPRALPGDVHQMILAARQPDPAQCLSLFHRIEERGNGFRRMHDKMIDHGLDQPRLATDTGYFQVIFSGPRNDLKRLRIPAGQIGQIVPPFVEEQLNGRQKKMTALRSKAKNSPTRSVKSYLPLPATLPTGTSFDSLSLALPRKKALAGRPITFCIERNRSPGIVR
jgi:ATP-dependent DNA helicase RecG